MNVPPLDSVRVAGVLRDAQSLRSAVYRLQTSEKRLRKVCSSDDELRKLYTAAAQRGRAKANRAQKVRVWL